MSTCWHFSVFLFNFLSIPKRSKHGVWNGIWIWLGRGFKCFFFLFLGYLFTCSGIGTIGFSWDSCLFFIFSFGVLVVDSHKRWMHFGLLTGQLGWKSNWFEPIIFPCFLFILRRYLNGIATRHRSTELMTLPREKRCSSETEIPLPYLEGIPPASVHSRCKQS